MKLINYLNKSENSIPILLALTMLSLSYPYGIPIFGTLTVFFVFIKLIKKNIYFRMNIGFAIYFICVLFYMLGMSFNGGVIYSFNASDITNIITFFLVWILLSGLKIEDYPILLHKFAKITVIFSFVVSIISLYKFLMLLNGIQIQTFFVGTDYPSGTSLVRDYNMFSLGISSGLVMSVYLLSKSKKTSHLLFYILTFLLTFSSIIFAGSRRGWVIAIIMLAFLLFMGIKYILTHRFETNVIRFFKFGAAAFSVFVFLFLTSILFNVDVDFAGSEQAERLAYRFETLQFNQVQESFYDSRTEQWDHAEKMFSESNPIQMFIGSGFGYLTEFGHLFTISSEESYPHSPLHSALLYSGLIGVLAILTLMIWSVFKSIKHLPIVGVYFPLLFFISCLFILISANSIFSINALMLIILVLISIPDRKSLSES